MLALGPLIPVQIGDVLTLVRGQMSIGHQAAKWAKGSRLARRSLSDMVSCEAPGEGARWLAAHHTASRTIDHLTEHGRILMPPIL